MTAAPGPGSAPGRAELAEGCQKSRGGSPEWLRAGPG
jgi:hypothetical protein